MSDRQNKPAVAVRMEVLRKRGALHDIFAVHLAEAWARAAAQRDWLGKQVRTAPADRIEWLREMHERTSALAADMAEAVPLTGADIAAADHAARRLSIGVVGDVGDE